MRGVCRDMCDNMERFFYQAWKEASLPLPPGAGPTLSRTRPKDPMGPAWQDEQQGARSNKRKRTDAHYEVFTTFCPFCCSFVHLHSIVHLHMHPFIHPVVCSLSFISVCATCMFIHPCSHSSVLPPSNQLLASTPWCCKSGRVLLPETA